ncbi:ABC transporter permease [Pseudonocardia ailaonensis]|uniref:ABC transporter permease n=1 Tax=Pseudonocardia ailaonensis TaxID=367279 RepID=A0ABN2N6A1_9PSEU
MTAVRRLLGGLAVVWGAVTLTFLALHLTPGSTVDAIVGQSVVTPEVRAQIVAEYGLDQPLWIQYLSYLGRLVRGDLGHSYGQGTQVAEAIGEQFGSTLLLVAVGLGLAFGGAVLVAAATAHRSRWWRGSAVGAERVSVAVPPFWLGILLLVAFSFSLRWFPAIGSDSPRGLVLPAVALAVAPAAMLSQVMRHALEKTLEEPFVTSARARGLTRTAVLARHAVRHALLPVVTLAGWLVAAFIGGAIVTETVFARQGLGRLTVTAIEGKDFPLVSGLVLVSAVAYVVVGIGVDALYGVLDPRLRAST